MFILYIYYYQHYYGTHKHEKINIKIIVTDQNKAFMRNMLIMLILFLSTMI